MALGGATVHITEKFHIILGSMRLALNDFFKQGPIALNYCITASPRYEQNTAISLYGPCIENWLDDGRRERGLWPKVADRHGPWMTAKICSGQESVDDPNALSLQSKAGCCLLTQINKRFIDSARLAAKYPTHPL